jgi:uroporphyrin-III C-methyltransferase
MEQGRSSATPVIVIENCSRDDQRIQYLQLGDLERGLAECHGPVLVMIGDALGPREINSA